MEFVNSNDTNNLVVNKEKFYIVNYPDLNSENELVT